MGSLFLKIGKTSGKGRGHPAQRNLGDCFAYAVANNLEASFCIMGGQGGGPQFLHQFVEADACTRKNAPMLGAQSKHPRGVASGVQESLVAGARHHLKRTQKLSVRGSSIAGAK